MSTTGAVVREATDYAAKILPERERARVRNGWLKYRLANVLPEIMAREGVDCWIVSAREYNECPVIMTLQPEPNMYARRRTILAYFRQADGSLERLAVARYGQGEYYQAAWDPDKEEQWDCLARLIRERDPKTIGICVSDTFAFGDGLTHSEYLALTAALGPEYTGRLRGAERVAVGWLERRTPDEIATYGGIVEIAHAIVAEAFSSQVILPGVTTAEDVVWWMREKVTSLGLRTWFQPSVSIQAQGLGVAAMGVGGGGPSRQVIMPGDLLHCDFGIVYLGLCTDTQEDAYVLKLGESEAPAGLRAALAAGNRLQDIHCEAMTAGRTGNEILAETLERARAEGIRPQVYTHPLGYHGHAAGPTIGLWDQQGGVPGRGDYELFEDTAHSIELNVKHDVPEWGGHEVRMAIEQDVIFTGGKCHWLDGRQTKLHLIG